MKEIDNDKSIYDDSLGEALLEIKSTNPSILLNEHQSFDIMECLYSGDYCFKITYSSNEGITTYNDLSDISYSSLDNDYLILFYDKLPNVENLYSYLFDFNSSFRIIRLGDSEVVYDHFIKNKQKCLKK